MFVVSFAAFIPTSQALPAGREFGGKIYVLVFSFLLLDQSSAIDTNVGTRRATSLQSIYLNLYARLYFSTGRIEFPQ